LELEQLLSVFVQQIQSQSLLDWAITGTALAYVWLAARENAWCWAFGMVSSSLWAWADFARYNLWVDGYLQVFYVLMSAIGLYVWLFAKRNKSDKPQGQKLAISTLSFRQHLWLWLVGGALTVALGYAFKNYTNTSFPYADSFITAFSIIATFLTVKKILGNWYYWIVFDTFAIFLFWAKGAMLLAFVMVVYALMAWYGLRQWKLEMNAKPTE
jgi:nicotinamide mononucleotide transporter